MRGHNVSILTGLITVVGVGVSIARAQSVTSTFDAGLEGWTSVGNGAGAPVFSPVAGNPGGAIQLTDVVTGYGYFQAPASFVFPGAGSFSFDLNATANGPEPILYVVQVALEGNGLTLLNGFSFPTSSFVHYSVLFHESAGWRLYPSRDNSFTPGGGTAPTAAQFQSIINNPTGLYISADHTDGTTQTGTIEITTLDNVNRTVTACEPCDADCSGVVDLNDMGPFVNALLGNPTGCSPCQADTNADALANGADVAGFVACLVGP